MAVCEFCKQEMLDPEIVHCSWNRVVEYPNGEVRETLAYTGPGVRCHDCNIARGYKHHPGCDMEECPRCLGQLISCGCLDEEQEIIDKWEKYLRVLREEAAPAHQKAYEEKQIVFPFCECPWCWNLRQEESIKDAEDAEI